MHSRCVPLPKTLVVGLGNPLLGDDGVGWLIAERLAQDIYHPDVDILCLARGGLYLMERMIGYQRVILIDSITSPQQANGRILQFSADDLPEVVTRNTVSSHDTSLQTALHLGRSLGLALPFDIRVIAVVIEPLLDVQAGLSQVVASAVPRVCDLVEKALGLTLSEQTVGTGLSPSVPVG